MKRKLRSGISACLAGLVLSAAAYGAEPSCIVRYDYKNNNLTVSGTSGSGKAVAIQILKKDKSFDLPHGSADVLFGGQVSAEDKSGKFEFAVEYGAETEPGEYIAKIASESGESEIITLFLNTSAGLEAAYSEVNSAASSGEAFENAINSKRKELNFAFTLTDGKTLGSELNSYMEYIKANPLTIESEDNNTRIFKTFMTAEALNQKELADIDSVIRELYFEDSDILPLYEKLSEADGATRYFTGKAEGKGIKNLDEFEKVAKESLILTTVKYSDGIADIQSVLNKYGSIIGVTSSVSENVCRELARIGDFKDGAALKSKINELGSSQDSGTSPGGGRTDGGKGSGSGLPAGGKVTETGGTISPVKLTFEDIDGVAWASEAILALADKGIISGKGNGIFAPNDYVTREEFAKILVSAMGLENSEYSGGAFKDADGEAWYYKYIHIAKEHNIISGTGEETFGVGSKITRQDMAVMIYRALQSKGAKLDGGENLGFADKDEISDYAYEAVSALFNAGIVSGMSETEFAPLGNATRAQAAKIVYSILNLIG